MTHQGPARSACAGATFVEDLDGTAPVRGLNLVSIWTETRGEHRFERRAARPGRGVMRAESSTCYPHPGQFMVGDLGLAILTVQLLLCGWAAPASLLSPRAASRGQLPDPPG